MISLKNHNFRLSCSKQQNFQIRGRCEDAGTTSIPGFRGWGPREEGCPVGPGWVCPAGDEKGPHVFWA